MKRLSQMRDTLEILRQVCNIVAGCEYNRHPTRKKFLCQRECHVAIQLHIEDGCIEHVPSRHIGGFARASFLSSDMPVSLPVGFDRTIRTTGASKMAAYCELGTDSNQAGAGQKTPRQRA